MKHFLVIFAFLVLIFFSIKAFNLFNAWAGFALALISILGLIFFYTKKTN